MPNKDTVEKHTVGVAFMRPKETSSTGSINRTPTKSLKSYRGAIFLKLVQRRLENIAIFAIGFYRKYISCLMLPRCRFYPTCSVYAQEAIKKRGLMRGLGMSLRRLLRCHPFSRAPFYDPVDK